MPGAVTTDCHVRARRYPGAGRDIRSGDSRCPIVLQGSDNNACTFAAPCASFTKAYTTTEASGEIVVLDPGSYGLLEITKPITIKFHSKILDNITAGIQLIGATSDALLSGDKIIASPKSLDLQSGSTASSYGDNVLSAGDPPTTVKLQ
jgi:hypothetical protein